MFWTGQAKSNYSVYTYNRVDDIFEVCVFYQFFERDFCQILVAM